MEQTGQQGMDADPQDQAGPIVTFDGAAFDWAGRIGIGVVSIPFGILSAWMFWMVHKFLNGHGWFDLIVGTVLDTFVLMVGLFSLTLLVGAIFGPRWLPEAFEAILNNMVLAIAGVGLLIGSAFLIVVFVVPVLIQMGYLR